MDLETEMRNYGWCGSSVRKTYVAKLNQGIVNSCGHSREKLTSPRSGRQHKAWGGAQRNPRRACKKFGKVREADDSVGMMSNDAIPDTIARRKEHHAKISASAGFANPFITLSWGCATLHPRLYAVARFAG